MKKWTICHAFFFLLIACENGADRLNSDEIDNKNTSDMVVNKFDELPKCSENYTGVVAYVKTEKIGYECSGKFWVADRHFVLSSSSGTSYSYRENVDNVLSSSETVFFSSSSEKKDEVLFEDKVNWVYLNHQVSYEVFVDGRDNQVYKSVVIGSQIWMAENLNFEAPGSVCYSGDMNNCDKYGRLYTWSIAIDSIGLLTSKENPQDCGYARMCSLPLKVRGICPDKWHLPTKNEWSELITTAGGESVAGKILKSQMGWSNNGDGSDDYGFSALPAGYMGYEGWAYHGGKESVFWSATEGHSSMAYVMLLKSTDNSMYLGYYDMWKNNKYSVRCIQDEN